MTNTPTCGCDYCNPDNFAAGTSHFAIVSLFAFCLSKERGEEEIVSLETTGEFDNHKKTAT